MVNGTCHLPIPSPRTPEDFSDETVQQLKEFISRVEKRLVRCPGLVGFKMILEPTILEASALFSCCKRDSQTLMRNKGCPRVLEKNRRKQLIAAFVVLMQNLQAALTTVREMGACRSPFSKAIMYEHCSKIKDMLDLVQKL